jgi:Concanavalin A-like lectin/glucanases superfamily
VAVRLGVLVALVCLGIGCVDLKRPDELDARERPDASDGRIDRPVVELGGGGDLPPDEDASDVPMEMPDTGGDLATDDDSLGDAADAGLARGLPCASAAQCASGFCAQGVCCDRTCNEPCLACNLAATAGTCTPVLAGEDPRESCAAEPPAGCGLDGTCDGQGACRRYRANTECKPGSCANGIEYGASTCDGRGGCLPSSTRACTSGACSGDSCAAPCSAAAPCQAGFFCAAGRCTRTRALGAVCAAGLECASGFCADGVCCDSECNETCFACNGAPDVGKCKPVPSGADPRKQCLAADRATCKNAGGCNGAGACRLYPLGTTCGAGSCSGTSEVPARTCDGLGVCRNPGPAASCAPYVCAGASCGKKCTDSAGCVPGYSCQTEICARDARLALFWRFEESFGGTAFDSSGNGQHGAFTGESGLPTPSSNLPPLMHGNSFSRQFTRSSRHAVRLPRLPSVLRPVNDFSISVWFRTTSVDVNGGSPIGEELVSGADSYILRLRANQLEFTKRYQTGDFVRCFAPATTATNGQWHHMAAVASRTAGVRLYFDGAQVCSVSDTANVVYNPGDDGFWVGRHASDQDQWDFEGHIDEVRFYTRPLSAAEVKALSEGRNN